MFWAISLVLLPGFHCVTRGLLAAAVELLNVYVRIQHMLLKITPEYYYSEVMDEFKLDMCASRFFDIPRMCDNTSEVDVGGRS
ncbi:hypothetical protein GQ44DRAFT_697811 [Phaeosphaeriaceae sp. PMI808]|nr:hypothetical protein GQ44DRAFT_697811 [Phaeosphaeriaceae sp. PMI808]